MREEEKNSVTKMKFRRLFRKKWVYPAIYLSVAALVLAGVLWYQQGANDVTDLADEPNSEVNDEFVDGTLDGEDSVPVMDHQENVEMPVADSDNATIVTKFYDHQGSDEDQENALVLYENRYYQSTGVDITKNDEAFDVTAALSGTVTEVKEDPLYGNVVQIAHGEDVATVYASLGEIQVEAGAEVKQGDVIGTAGQNVFGQASGVHVHFELRKDGEAVNPEAFFGKPLSELDAATEEEEQPGEEQPDGEQSGEEQQNDQVSEQENADHPGEPDEGETPYETDAPDEDVEEGTEQPEGDEEEAPSDDAESSSSMTRA
ncbi:peptidoglycan DD-metalloendopeptidase family protein [Thalassobacillus hwangdonensis]|uniref:Peptidoglycan DD-metalloendopeptidase family protein n=1 Tax=Thalassobacillus hwangdonensis TaxID=546108 RepID=A0ABW3L524_9BACI